MENIRAWHVTILLCVFVSTAVLLQQRNGNTDKWFLPFGDSASNAVLFRYRAGSCPLTPLSMHNAPGCVYLKNASTSQVNSIKSQFESALRSTNFKYPMFEDLKKHVIIPLTNKVANLFTSASDIRLEDSNLCLGEYNSTKSFYFYDGVCHELPLTPHKWSVFGFALSLGRHSPLLPLCTSFNRGYASFCLAVAKDCHSNPSIVFSFNPYLFKCQPFNPILSFSNSGLSRLFVVLGSQIVKQVTFGVSFSNSFIEKFELNTVNDVAHATMAGTVYTSGGIEMKPKDFLYYLPNFMSLRGEGTKVLSVEGLDAVERTIDWIKYDPLRVEKILKSLESWENIAYRLYLDIHGLKFDLLFSELSKGIGLQDFKDINLGRAQVYVSNAPYTTSIPLLPGICIHANGIDGDEVRPLLEALLKRMDKTFAALQQWLPFHLTPSQLLNWIDLDALNFEFALSLTVDKVRFMISAPLMGAFTKFIKITCVINLGKRDLSCIPEAKRTQ